MNCFFRQQRENLYNCTKPYQYVGGEFLSCNKDFDKAQVRIALAFPDKYEIGIWITIDSNIYINITENNLDKVIKYFFERCPW